MRPTHNTTKKTMKNLVTFLFLGAFATSSLLSCDGKRAEDTSTKTTDTLSKDTVIAYDYAQDWTLFVEAINAGSKNDVIAFIDSTNTNLQNEVALNYEYFFDDIFKAQVSNLTYSALETGEYNGAPAKTVKIVQTYTEGDVELESMYIFYFGETPNGLKIIHIEIAG